MRVSTYHINTAIFLLLICFIPAKIVAQQDSTSNEYEKAFNDFSNSINTEFDSFKSKNDSIFYHFLDQSWKSFKLFTNTRQAIPKPVAQPITDTIVHGSIKIIPSKRKTMLQDSGRQLILNGKPANYNNLSTLVPYTTFSFYGTDISIPKQNEATESLSNISNKVIALYYKESSNNNEILATIDFLHEKAYNTNLNGWGYLKLLQAASHSMYSNINDQVLFTWLALLKSGYDAKVGYDNNTVYLLVSFDTPIFYNSYFELNGNNYYLIINNPNKADLSNITSYEANYPEEVNKLSLAFKKAPTFNNKTKTRVITYNGQHVKLSYDANITDYYRTYPECDLMIYFPPPLSEVALKSIGDFLLPLIEGKTDEEKINILLDFIQHAIAYKTDEQQFGKENYLFAEESICYPFADCEDRSILLSQLIRRYVGLQTIAVTYPNHVSVGVKLNEGIEGSYINYKNLRYYLADPTYIGAKLGMVMPEYANTSPDIVEF